MPVILALSLAIGSRSDCHFCADETQFNPTATWYDEVSKKQLICSTQLAGWKAVGMNPATIGVTCPELQATMLHTPCCGGGSNDDTSSQCHFCADETQFNPTATWYDKKKKLKTCSTQLAGWKAVGMNPTTVGMTCPELQAAMLHTPCCGGGSNDDTSSQSSDSLDEVSNDDTSRQSSDSLDEVVRVCPPQFARPPDLFKSVTHIYQQYELIHQKRTQFLPLPEFRRHFCWRWLEPGASEDATYFCASIVLSILGVGYCLLFFLVAKHQTKLRILQEAQRAGAGIRDEFHKREKKQKEAAAKNVENAGDASESKEKDSAKAKQIDRANEPKEETVVEEDFEDESTWRKIWSTQHKKHYYHHRVTGECVWNLAELNAKRRAVAHMESFFSAEELQEQKAITVCLKKKRSQRHLVINIVTVACSLFFLTAFATEAGSDHGLGFLLPDGVVVDTLCSTLYSRDARQGFEEDVESWFPRWYKEHLMHATTPLPVDATKADGMLKLDGGWKRYHGYLVQGNDILDAYVTIAEAYAWCNITTDCDGFTFQQAVPSKREIALEKKAELYDVVDVNDLSVWGRRVDNQTKKKVPYHLEWEMAFEDEESFQQERCARKQHYADFQSSKVHHMFFKRRPSVEGNRESFKQGNVAGVSFGIFTAGCSKEYAKSENGWVSYVKPEKYAHAASNAGLCVRALSNPSLQDGSDCSSGACVADNTSTARKLVEMRVLLTTGSIDLAAAQRLESVCAAGDANTFNISNTSNTCDAGGVAAAAAAAAGSDSFPAMLREWIQRFGFVCKSKKYTANDSEKEGEEGEEEGSVLSSNSGVQTAERETDKEKEKVEMFMSMTHPMMDIYRLPVLMSPEEVETTLDLTEAHTNEHGWTSRRHSSYPTTDVPVEDVKGLYAYLRDCGYLSRMRNAISSAYGLEPTDLLLHDHFIVKYEHGQNLQASLDPHQDGDDLTILSYNLVLSHPEDFDGGGTYFPGLRGRRQLYFSAGRGAGVVHPSKMRHGGEAITRGTRYLLVGFLKLRTPLAAFHKKIADFTAPLNALFAEYRELL